MASAEIYALVWSNFCDWYIEFCKVAIQKSNNVGQTNSLIKNLILNFYSILELLHPFMPFITEELSSKLADLGKLDKSGFLVEGGFSHAQASNQDSEMQLDKVINIISALRVIRAENQSIKNETLNLIISNDLNSDTQSIIIENELVISGIAKLGKIEFSDKIPAESIEKTLDGYKIIIPLEGLINPEEERIRLQKELSKLENEIKRISSKLDNEQFIAKAPAEVIQKEKEKIEDAKNKKKMLEKSILNLEI